MVLVLCKTGQVFWILIYALLLTLSMSSNPFSCISGTHPLCCLHTCSSSPHQQTALNSCQWHFKLKIYRFFVTLHFWTLTIFPDCDFYFWIKYLCLGLFFVVSSDCGTVICGSVDVVWPFQNDFLIPAPQALLLCHRLSPKSNLWPELGDNTEWPS